MPSVSSQLLEFLYGAAGPASVLMFFGFIVAASLVAYESGLRQFFAEVKNQSAQVDESNPFRAGETLLIRKLGKLSLRFLSERHRANLQRRMIMAGLDMRDSLIKRPEEFVAVQELAAVGFILVIAWVCARLDQNLIYSLLGLVIGPLLVVQWLRDQVTKRALAISRALPYNLDLLTLSVEAGLDFTGALNKVVERGRKGPLLDELALVLRQLKMGKTRADSLKIMVDRVNLPALTTFVSALIQADKMGTPLGKILRIQSQQLRIERTQRAEKLANEAPVKMLGPLIFCIFPTVFVIIFGPIALQLLNQP